MTTTVHIGIVAVDAAVVDVDAVDIVVDVIADIVVDIITNVVVVDVAGVVVNVTILIVNIVKGFLIEKALF